MSYRLFDPDSPSHQLHKVAGRSYQIVLPLGVQLVQNDGLRLKTQVVQVHRPNHHEIIVFMHFISGQLMTDVANVICSHFWNISGSTVAILNGLLPGITGGRMVLFTGAVCYVTDTTGVEMRTFR